MNQSPRPGNWWSSPFRLMCIELGSRDIQRYDARQMLQKVRALGVNVFHLTGFYHFGRAYYPTELAPRVNDLGRRDLLKEFTAEAARLGMQIICYVNVSWFDGDWGRKHPEWIMRDATGQPVEMLFGFKGVYLCPNTPYWDHLNAIVAEIVTNYPVAGIFMDGPSFQEKGCYCENCRRLFREQFQSELSGSRRDPLDREFRHQSMERAIRKVQATVRAIRANTVVYGNIGGIGLTPLLYGLDPERAAQEDGLGDMFGAEIFVPGHIDKPVWYVNVQSRYAQAIGYPSVVFCGPADYPWELTQASPVETRLNIWNIAAHGANPGVYMEDTTWYDYPESTAAVGEALRFVEDHADLYAPRQSLAKVALVWSNQTHAYYHSAKDSFHRCEAYWQTFCGIYDILSRGHVEFDLLLDAHLERPERLAPYRLLILPNVAVLSDPATAGIEEFVRGGGKLLATYETSLVDAEGQRRKDFALKNVIGCSFSGKKWGPLPYSYWEATNTEVHHRLVGKDQAHIPSPEYVLVTEPARGAEVPLVALPPREAQYVKLTREGACPAMVVSKAGKGEAIYFSGPIERQYWATRSIAIQNLLTHVVKSLAGPPIIEVEGPESVIVHSYRQTEPGRVVVHLLNYTGEMQRPIHKPVAIHDVVIRYRGAPSECRALRAGKPLALVSQPDTTTTILPTLQEYEVLLFPDG